MSPMLATSAPASQMPIAPADAARISASVRISPITRPLEKPSVLRTAISVRRSRTAMLIVLAVTRSTVKATARPMPFSSRTRLPAISLKLWMKAPSDSVFVCTSEFSKPSSIALATAAAWAGSLTCTMNMPTPARCRVASNRYWKWKNICSSLVAGYRARSAS